jgi:small subunit ribosomal protein S6
MAIYETIFILDSLIPPKDIEATIQKYSEIITENGGSIREVDKWGKRRLAYEIQKKQYGFYVAIEFEGPGSIPRHLESDYNYNDKVLRFLTYRYDKNKLKAMELEKEKPESVKRPVLEEPEPELISESTLADDTSNIAEKSLPEEPVTVEDEPVKEEEKEPELDEPKSEDETVKDNAESEEEIAAEKPEADEEGEEKKS